MSFGVLFVLPLAAVAAALVSQHRFDMQPCPWCVLQRVVFVAISLAALPALLVPQRGVHQGSAAVALLLALAGAAAALWQHFVAAASASCAMTLADRIVRGAGLDELWPEAFSATASCAEAAVKLFGVPYEFWSLGLFGVLAVVALRAIRLRGRSRL